MENQNPQESTNKESKANAHPVNLQEDIVTQSKSPLSGQKDIKSDIMNGNGNQELQVTIMKENEEQDNHDDEKCKTKRNIEEELLRNLFKIKLEAQDGNFERAIDDIQEIMEQATSYYKDPNSIKMFPYYFEYGNMLLRKTENTNELFTNAMAQKEEEKEKGGNKESKASIPNSKENEGIDSKTKEDDEVESSEEDIDDLQISWEIFELTKVILTNELKVNKTPSEVKYYNKKLSEVFQCLGDIECIKECHDEGLKCYKQALGIIEKIYEDSLARRKAEIMFKMGTALIYSASSTSDVENEQQALEKYNEARTILYNVLCKNVCKGGKIPKEQMKIFGNDSKEVKELKQIIQLFDIKIEDAKINIKVKEQFKGSAILQGVTKPLKPFKDTTNVVKQSASENKDTKSLKQDVVMLGNFGNAKDLGKDVKKPETNNQVVMLGNFGNANTSKIEQKKEFGFINLNSANFMGKRSREKAGIDQNVNEQDNITKTLKQIKQ